MPGVAYTVQLPSWYRIECDFIELSECVEIIYTKLTRLDNRNVVTCDSYVQYLANCQGITVIYTVIEIQFLATF
jgi:hypothetical protein